MISQHVCGLRTCINPIFRYGAVVRGTNAYVPPGARRSGAMSPPVSNAAAVVAEIPKVSVNGPDGTTLPSQTQSPSSSKAPSPAPPNKVCYDILLVRSASQHAFSL